MKTLVCVTDHPGRIPSTAGLFATLFAAAACAGPAGEGRTYVERLGTDTTAVETLTRGAAGYEGERLTRQPVTRVARYRAELDDDGHVRRLEVEWTTPAENPEGPPPRRLAVELDGEGATMVDERGEEVDTTRVEAPPGTIPALGVPFSVATWEQIVRQARASGDDPYEFRLLLPGGRLAPNALERRSADTVAMDFFGSPIVAEVSAEGGIRGISGRETTLKIEVRPADDASDIEVTALASGFAVRDARGEGFGIASPTDTVAATAAGASFEVVYGRPAMRGRRIWGGLVPSGRVWRTGANAATHFTTDRELSIAGRVVPAGTYTLWTTFTPGGASLILNEQTRIWGTHHDPVNDFARVPLERTTLEEPVERFTITITPTADGAVLALAWDTVRFGVPMVVR